MGPLTHTGTGHLAVQSALFSCHVSALLFRRSVVSARKKGGSSWGSYWFMLSSNVGMKLLSSSCLLNNLAIAFKFSSASTAHMKKKSPTAAEKETFAYEEEQVGGSWLPRSCQRLQTTCAAEVQCIAASIDVTVYQRRAWGCSGNGLTLHLCQTDSINGRPHELTAMTADTFASYCHHSCPFLLSYLKSFPQWLQCFFFKCGFNFTVQKHAH